MLFFLTKITSIKSLGGLWWENYLLRRQLLQEPCWGSQARRLRHVVLSLSLKWTGHRHSWWPMWIRLSWSRVMAVRLRLSLAIQCQRSLQWMKKASQMWPVSFGSMLLPLRWMLQKPKVAFIPCQRAQLQVWVKAGGCCQTLWKRTLSLKQCLMYLSVQIYFHTRKIHQKVVSIRVLQAGDASYRTTIFSGLLRWKRRDGVWLIQVQRLASMLQLLKLRTGVKTGLVTIGHQLQLLANTAWQC